MRVEKGFGLPTHSGKEYKKKTKKKIFDIN